MFQSNVHHTVVYFMLSGLVLFHANLLSLCGCPRKQREYNLFASLIEDSFDYLYKWVGICTHSNSVESYGFRMRFRATRRCWWADRMKVVSKTTYDDDHCEKSLTGLSDRAQMLLTIMLRFFSLRADCECVLCVLVWSWCETMMKWNADRMWYTISWFSHE